MSVVVLDTNIVSYLERRDPRAALYRTHIEGRTLAVSFATVGELYEGAISDGWGEERIGRLEEMLKGYVVVPYSPEVCRQWGAIRTARRHRTISENDAWIAATAVAHGCPLITHDTDFDGVPGLDVVTEPGS